MPAPTARYAAEVAIGNRAIDGEDGTQSIRLRPQQFICMWNRAEARTNAHCARGRHRCIPWDHPWAIFRGGVKDQFGIIGYIAEPSGRMDSGPEGVPSVSRICTARGAQDDSV